MEQGSEFTAHHLRFEVEALTPLLLPAHAGPSIRGALWGALQRHFCPAPGTEQPTVEHKALCPVCWLMATEEPGNRRGRDVPRPYTVEPPAVDGREGWHPRSFEPGQRFAFGLTLFAQAVSLFPYLVVAMPIMGQTGMGIPLEENASRRGEKRRGQFALHCIEAVNPLAGEQVPLMGAGQTMVQVPGVPVIGRDVARASAALLEQMGDGSQLQLRFRTPTRIVEGGHLARRPWLGPLVRRLLERLDALRGAYAGEPPEPDRERLVELADGVRLVRDHTRWLEVRSGSRRLGRTTPVSGFVGTAAYEAERDTWQALLPYLVWGQEIHVGKNATKGDGWYEVEAGKGG